MFAGPQSAAASHNTSSEFHANFDFAKRQDFTASGMNLDTGNSQVEAFADFTAFEDESDPSSGFEQQPAFADFASFADFDSGFSEPSEQSTPFTDDFVPTTF